MAQRTIHYLFGQVMSEQFKFKDLNRFLLGSILPDAYSDVSNREISHYIVMTPTQIYFDFNKFQKQYFNLILQDDLYLGYYMHLVEDAFYRQFIYSGRFIMPSSREDVEVLHHDYHILNSYIVNNYHIRNVFEEDIDLSSESINNITKFDVNSFLSEMQDDFVEQTTGDTCFMKEEMLDEFVETYISLGIKELHNIQTGKFGLNAVDFARSR